MNEPELMEFKCPVCDEFWTATVDSITEIEGSDGYAVCPKCMKKNKAKPNGGGPTEFINEGLV